MATTDSRLMLCQVWERWQAGPDTLLASTALPLGRMLPLLHSPALQPSALCSSQSFRLPLALHRSPHQPLPAPALNVTIAQLTDSPLHQPEEPHLDARSSQQPQLGPAHALLADSPAAARVRAPSCLPGYSLLHGSQPDTTPPDLIKASPEDAQQAMQPRAPTVPVAATPPMRAGPAAPRVECRPAAAPGPKAVQTGSLDSLPTGAAAEGFTEREVLSGCDPLSSILARWGLEDSADGAEDEDVVVAQLRRSHGRLRMQGALELGPLHDVQAGLSPLAGLAAQPHAPAASIGDGSDDTDELDAILRRWALPWPASAEEPRLRPGLQLSCSTPSDSPASKASPMLPLDSSFDEELQQMFAMLNPRDTGPPATPRGMQLLAWGEAAEGTMQPAPAHRTQGDVLAPPHDTGIAGPLQSAPDLLTASPSRQNSLTLAQQPRPLTQQPRSPAHHTQAGSPCPEQPAAAADGPPQPASGGAQAPASPACAASLPASHGFKQQAVADECRDALQNDTHEAAPQQEEAEHARIQVEVECVLHIPADSLDSW